MYSLGQQLPPSKERGLMLGEAAPTWYILQVAPQRERATVQYLKQQKIYSFYPDEKKVKVVKGKRRETSRPIVSGYVYAKFQGKPQWDVLKARRLITSVVSVGGVPFIVPQPIIKRMQGLTVEVQDLREARREAERQLYQLSEGDMGEIMSGPFKGALVQIGAVGKNQVEWSNALIKGKAEIGVIRRVDQ